MSIKRILVGTDYSEQADEAIQHALNLAIALGAELRIVHALTALSVSPPYPAMAASLYTPQTDEVIRLGNEQLAEEVKRWSGKGVTVSSELPIDMPVPGTLEAAKNFGADLIVVGTHGRSGVSRFLMGSVAQRVAQRAEIDVMVTRGPAPKRYKKILVPTDFSNESAHALARAHELAGDEGNVHVLHCWQLPAGKVDHWGPPASGVGASIQKAAEQLAHELLSPYAKREGGVRFLQRLAEPREGIQEALAEDPYDLVVMGSRGHGAVGRWILGSVAEATIRYSKVPVYIARRPHEEE
jgi:nucleotide-binding universal stress UspA family protein